MSKPILTFAVSDDGNSVFVYTGDITQDEQVLEAVLGLQREDFDYQIAEYAVHGVREMILSKLPH